MEPQVSQQIDSLSFIPDSDDPCIGCTDYYDPGCIFAREFLGKGACLLFNQVPLALEEAPPTQPRAVREVAEV